MRGRNPFLDEGEVRAPTKAYTIRVLPMDVTVTVDPENLHGGHLGLRGSILGELAEAGIDIEHACGGVCACSTCHVIIKQGIKSCGLASEEEEDMLDGAPALTPQSRLACQTIPDGSADLVVMIPEWNRNLVKEGH
jgi:2Fe-2S ferredoxin